MCLKDTHVTPDLEPYMETQWGYKCVFNSFRSNCRGVSIMLNNNFEFTIKDVKKDCDGNLIAIDMNIEGNNITLINIYGPNYDNPDFYEKVK